MKPRFILLFLIFSIFYSCKEDKIYVPKPRMYPKINFPIGHDYVWVDTLDCGFRFLKPSYASIQKDSFIFENKTPSECWFDIDLSQLNSKIYCSYYPINKENSLTDLIDDSFEMAGKHNIKAEYRRESLIEIPDKKIYGLMFEISGPVASPIQFYVTDSTSHFLRASLYFESKVNPDSTAPVLQFIRKDIDKMIDKLEWKNK